MGKRKKAAKKPTGPKRNEPLATVFPCLFCNHEKSVTVKLDKKTGVGQLNCKVCNQQFQCSVNYLSAAVDVYADWVDACDAVAKENENNDSISRIGAPRRSIGGGAAPHKPAARRERSDEGDEDLDDLIDDGDVDADDLGYGGGEGIRADEDDY